MSSQLKLSDVSTAVMQRIADGSRLDEDGCWIWQKFSRRIASGRRYPLMSIAGRQRPVQLVAWRGTHGVDEGLPNRIQQSCGKDLCVRPDHQIAGVNTLAAYNASRGHNEHR